MTSRGPNLNFSIEMLTPQMENLDPLESIFARLSS